MLSQGSRSANLNFAPTAEYVPRDSFFDFEGIRFTPKVIVFEDVFEGETKEVTFTIQNIRQLPVVVRVYPPNSYAFQLHVNMKKQFLPPGLSMSGVLKFTNRRHSVARLMLDVFIGNSFVEYPIYVYMASPYLQIQPNQLDFGVVDVGSAAVTRYLVLRNTGAVGTKFYVDLGANDLDLVVIPIRGIIRAHKAVHIRFEVVAVREGVYYKEFWITGTNRPLRCPVNMTVIMPKLVIHHPNTTGDFTLIDFMPTHMRAHKYEAMIVRNMSSQITTFVVLAEVNNELMSLEKVKDVDPAYEMFSVHPEEGRMQPFEGRIFTIRFNPSCRGRTLMKDLTSKDFLVFLRIMRVQCMDMDEIEEYIENQEKNMADDSFEIGESSLLASYECCTEEVVEKPLLTLSTSSLISDKQLNAALAGGTIVRLCLHGMGVVPQVTIQPTEIDFGRVEMGYEERRVLKLTNTSQLLSIGIRYKRQPGFDVQPPEFMLKPEQALEVTVIARPYAIGVKCNRLAMIHLDDWTKVDVGQTKVKVKFDCPVITTRRKPQFNPGLNPLIIKEVGIGAEEVTFKTPVQKPRAAVLQCDRIPGHDWAKPDRPTRPPKEKPTYFTKSAASTAKTADKSRGWPRRPESEPIAREKADMLITGVTESCVQINTLNCNLSGDNTLAKACRLAGQKPLPAEVTGCWVKVSEFTNDSYQFVVHTDPPARDADQGRERVADRDGKPRGALIAFPNDTQRSLRRWPEEQPCKTIFTGKDRYSCPLDPDNSLVPAQRSFKTWHDSYYTQYIRYTAGLLDTRKKIEHIFGSPQGYSVCPQEEYDISCSRLYNLMDMRAPVEVVPDVNTLLAIRRRKQAFRESRILKEHLVPLNPLMLYNVKVTPKALEFGKVASDFDTPETLTLTNMNDFSVQIDILPGRANVRVLQSRSAVLEANSQMRVNVVLNVDTLGRYNSCMHYVINDNHKFEVTVSADVVKRSLQLTVSEVVIGSLSPDEVFYTPFAVVGITNNLQALTGYHWEVPNNTSFTPQPLTGVVPPRRTIMCAIHSSPNPQGSQWSDLVLHTSNSTISQVLKCREETTKLRVAFVQPRLDIPDIPLNLLTTASTLVMNANYKDVMFKVLNPEPVPGMVVWPTEGVLKARSFHTLELRMQLCAVMEFDIIVTLIVQRTTHLDLYVHGNVTYPNVAIKPSALRLRRISADSFDSLRLSADNRGASRVQVQFNLDLYPEYSLSPNARKRCPGFGPDGFVLPPGGTQEFYLHFQPEDVATYEFYLPVVINGILGPPTMEDSESVKPWSYLSKFEANYKQATTILRDLVPKRLPTVKVDCTVAGHVLTFSRLVFNFEMWVEGKQGQQRPHQELRISNDHRHSATFCLRTDDLSGDRPPFALDYLDGVQPERLPRLLLGKLEPGESMLLRVTFDPPSFGIFSAEMPIYLRGYGNGTVFNYLYFTGSYSRPLLRCRQAEVFFVPVPLGVESEMFVTLYASYYPADTPVTAAVRPVVDWSGREVSHTITVDFVEGNTVPANQDFSYLRARLVFRSAEPTSFRTAVVFSNTFGSRTGVYVTATADNCILTVHAYRYAQEDSDEENPGDINARRIRKEKEKQLLEVIKAAANQQVPQNDETKGELSLRRVAPKTLRPQLTKSQEATRISRLKELLTVMQEPPICTFPFFPGTDDPTGLSRHMRRVLTVAEGWLYEQGFRCAFAAAIPDGLNLMMGGLMPADAAPEMKDSITMKTLIDLLFNLVGPTLTKMMPKTSLPKDNIQRVAEVYETYAYLIDFLNVQGACLAHINPKFLLNYDDYEIYLQKVRPLGPMKNSASSPDKQAGGVKSDHGDASPAQPPPLPKETRDPTYNHCEEDHFYDPDCRLCTHFMNRETFALRNKQSWLDVILQIYKVFVLSKVTLESYKDTARWPVKGTSSKSTTKLNVLECKGSSNGLAPKRSLLTTCRPAAVKSLTNVRYRSDAVASDEHCLAEAILLAWLSYNYDIQRSVLWGYQKIEGEGPPVPHVVTNFEDDLSDGLVLAALMVTYCPYLVPIYFTDLFTNPTTPEQVYHNAVRLTQAWDNVGLGFTVSPLDIVHPNPVRMVILTASLYALLPSLFPREMVDFQTGLTTDISRKIQLVNPSPFKVAYSAKLIGSQANFFSLERPSSVVPIQSKQQASITITYHARKICNVKATLVLNGSVFSPNFASHLVYSLEGEPIQLQTSSSFTFSAPICRPTDVSLPIQPPYPQSAEYEIWCTENEPKNTETFTADSWSNLRKRKVPRRLVLSRSRLTFNNTSEEGSPLKMTIACLAPHTRIFWLIFMHPEVGDFIVQITIVPRKSDKLADITTQLPWKWSAVECICEGTWETRVLGSESCPLRTSVPIPRRNQELWEAVMTVFEKTLDDSERFFWAKHLETNIGLRLIQWLLGETKDSVSEEFDHIFRTSVTYDVVCSSPDMIRVPSTLTIPDVRLTTTMAMPVHVSPAAPCPLQVTLTLTSEGGKECRSYSLHFLEPTKPPVVRRGVSAMPFA